MSGCTAVRGVQKNEMIAMESTLRDKEGEEESEKDAPEEADKPMAPKNTFANDGSFMKRVLPKASLPVELFHAGGIDGCTTKCCTTDDKRRQH